MITIRIDGPQGSGKTTLARKIKSLIESEGKTAEIIDSGGISPAGAAALKAGGDLDVLIRDAQ